AKATIFREGEVATSIFIVQQGHVVLEICASGVGCRQILTVGPGELLGWSATLKQAKFTATARAQDAVRLIEIDGAQSLAIWAQHPELGYEFMKLVALAMAKRINATRIQLLNVYGNDMPPLPEHAPSADESTSDKSTATEAR
ncbi:MAG: cyclic nucleotide-binding domain-containing protein, partial [Planctomycetaceae bacterium]|nr:cyclic nucleotide-binding domain-containing protein [Planctomycetaceae bacterium]